MLIETLDALARLDYPDYEVIVVDNNTRDPGVWQPVEQHCRALGERFKFFHVAPLVGLQGGRTELRASSIRALMRASSRSSTATTKSIRIGCARWCPDFAMRRSRSCKSPQDYRDAEENAFKAMCYAEYRGFFSIGMVVRNERNAIIQHGTMTLVRR